LLSTAADKPNILFVVVDDLGWNDVDHLPDQPSRYKTPQIRALAESGMIFDQAYAACPVCSPTRASLLTGKSPAALKLTAHIPGNPASNAKRIPKNSTMLPPAYNFQLNMGEQTFAELLKADGYTTAFIGKWHLSGAGSVTKRAAKGIVDPKFQPEAQGFDLNIGGCAYGQPPSYFDPYRNATIADRKPGEYLTDRLTDEAISFMIETRAAPFLAYLNYYNVHTPLKAKKADIALMAKAGFKGKFATYAAMTKSVDDNIGRLITALDDAGLRQNTLVIFTSDNGGLQGNAPLRGLKGEMWEGGVRVPQIVSWPGKIKAGTRCHEPVISYDFLPTLVAISESNSTSAKTPKKPKIS
jgi:arylsulfatase A